jgi:fucose permease
MAPLWPSGYTLASKSIKLTARISSLILLGDSFGGMILPWATGGVIERFGAQTMTLLVFVSLGFSFSAFLGMLRQRDALNKAAVPA